MNKTVRIYMDNVEIALRIVVQGLKYSLEPSQDDEEL